MLILEKLKISNPKLLFGNPPPLLTNPTLKSMAYILVLQVFSQGHLKKDYYLTTLPRFFFFLFVWQGVGGGVMLIELNA
jgi:hypothetical protein